MVTILALLLALAAPSARAATDLGPFQVTYYWFTAESGYIGKKITAPGLTGTYREDFLYSARGVPMQGTGTADGGGRVHFAGSSGGGWVNRNGQATAPRVSGWSNGAPFWRNGGWRNKTGGVTYQRADNMWVNGEGVTKLAYHDTFGPGAGTNVTEWLSIATDLDVIPRGTRVYVPKLAGTPARGCFRADDTGGAIIDNHIDVFVPGTTNLAGLPSGSDVLKLEPGEACPPLTGPKDIAGIALRYVAEPRERDFRSSRIAIPGMKVRARADFLFGSKGAAMRGGGMLPGRVRIILIDHGGYWVNARGKRTDRRSNGTWSNGNPVWRDGGWRNRRGAPTYPRPNGTWSNGRGVTLKPYRDRFRLAREGERIPWQAVAAPPGVAPRGARVTIQGLVSAGCLTVDRTLRHTTTALEILVPHGADLTGLPRHGDVTVLPSDTPCVQ